MGIPSLGVIDAKGCDDQGNDTHIYAMGTKVFDNYYYFKSSKEYRVIDMDGNGIGCEIHANGIWQPTTDFGSVTIYALDFDSLLQTLKGALTSIGSIGAEIGNIQTGAGSVAGAAMMEKAVQWGIDIAGDDSHGYSQANRDGPDYDCSSFIYYALLAGGFTTDQLGGSAWWTGSMKNILLSAGFTIVAAWDGTSGMLQRGDILLNEADHTEFYIGGGWDVAAANTAKGILVRPYYDFPWDCVLRYTG